MLTFLIPDAKEVPADTSGWANQHYPKASRQGREFVMWDFVLEEINLSRLDPYISVHLCWLCDLWDDHNTWTDEVGVRLQ